jgi:hypothetical protein
VLAGRRSSACPFCRSHQVQTIRIETWRSWSSSTAQNAKFSVFKKLQRQIQHLTHLLKMRVSRTSLRMPVEEDPRRIQVLAKVSLEISAISGCRHARRFPVDDLQDLRGRRIPQPWIPLLCQLPRSELGRLVGSGLLVAILRHSQQIMVPRWAQTLGRLVVDFLQGRELMRQELRCQTELVCKCFEYDLSRAHTQGRVQVQVLALVLVVAA